MTSSASAVSAQDLAKFATRGPRYTSYPPAPHFHKRVGESEVLAQISALGEQAGTKELSLYTHIPFCNQLCWYCGCNVKITRDQSRGAAYVTTLLKEIALYSKILPEWKLAELSLGGGSPNFLDIPTMQTLTAGVKENFPLATDAMLGIELMPRETTPEQISALAQLGFRRLSVGVQDFNPVVQDTINRHQSREQTADLIQRARDSGFTSAGVDLVYGLPGQTPASFASTMRTVIEIAPDRLALFGYAHLPHIIKHQKLVERQPIPDVPARAELLTTAIAMLLDAGYIRVGFDHFARPEDPLALAVMNNSLHRNFQGFTVPLGGPLIACGITGISESKNAYWQNVGDLEQWTKSVDSGHLPIARGLELREEDQIRRYAINRLMCDSELVLDDIGERFSIDARDYFSYELKTLQGPEYTLMAEVDEATGVVRPTPLGFELIRNLCMVFDPHLRGKEPSGSTTI